MKRPLVVAITALLIPAHRLPAPITEIPESPTASPTVAPTAKPKSKPLPKPKPKPKSEASESATNPARQQPSSKQSRFAGTWVGTMQAFPTGNVPIVLTVDRAETTMTMTWANEKPGLGKATLNGDAMQASFPGPFGTTKWTTWTLTPQPDGATARVRMQAFMNDFTAVFHRTAAESSSAKTAR